MEKVYKNAQADSTQKSFVVQYAWLISSNLNLSFRKGNPWMSIEANACATNKFSLGYDKYHWLEKTRLGKRRWSDMKDLNFITISTIQEFYYTCISVKMCSFIVSAVALKVKSHGINTSNEHFCLFGKLWLFQYKWTGEIWTLRSLSPRELNLK